MKKKNRKNNDNLNDNTINKIIEDLINKESRTSIAKKYQISIGKVSSIYDKNQFLIASEIGKRKMDQENNDVDNSDSSDTDKSYLGYSTEEALSIYNDLKSRKYTNLEIIHKYKIKDIHVLKDIKTGKYPSLPKGTSPLHIRSRRSRLSIERVREIEDMINNNVSTNDIMLKTGVAASTVRRIALGEHVLQKALNVINIDELSDEYSDILQDNADDNIVDLDGDIIPIQDICDNKMKRVLRYTKMGMVAERHNMPTSIYIFDSVDQYLMFDYDKQYEIAKKKILSEVVEDKKVRSGIALYVTGLSCVQGTISRVCAEYNIDLVLMHYNTAEREYKAQPIYNYSKTEMLPLQLNGLKFRDMFIYNCSMDEFMSRGGGYEVSECFYGPDDNATQLYRNLILFKTRDEAWAYYISITNSAIENNERKNIYLNKIIIKNNLYHKDGNICKSILVQ